MTYLYQALDGIWRNRCRRHIRTSGPYRAITDPVPSQVQICVICRPWGGGERPTTAPVATPMATIVAATQPPTADRRWPTPRRPASAPTPTGIDEIRQRARRGAASLKRMIERKGDHP